MKTIQDAIFRRSELLLGDEAMKQIAQKRVIIFGGDQGDRSLIFYFERGRDSGVKVVAVTGIWVYPSTCPRD